MRDVSDFSSSQSINTLITYLLTKHNNPGSQRSPSVSWHREQLEELRKEIFALVCFAFQLNANIGVVSVSSSLNIGVTQPLEAAKGFAYFIVFDVPSVHSVSASTHSNKACTNLGDSGQK